MVATYMPPPMYTASWPGEGVDPMVGPVYGWNGSGSTNGTGGTSPGTPPTTTPAPAPAPRPGLGNPGRGANGDGGSPNSGGGPDNGGRPGASAMVSSDSGGFAPGRFMSPTASLIAGIVPSYGIGTALNVANGLMGINSGMQQEKMLGWNPTAGDIASAATGMNLSARARGVGGYGNIGIGGYTGAQNMADPGVQGLARAMSADQVAGFAGRDGAANSGGGDHPGGMGAGNAQGPQAGRAGFARGGMLPQTPWFIRSAAREVYHNGGLFHSAVPGRTDRINASVPGGSYVMPADVVSGLGEGNTLAGANVLDKMMHSGPFGMKLGGGGHGSSIPRPPKAMRYSRGGEVKRVSIVAAGGEYLVHPDDVRPIGGGDLNKGHERLDQFVKEVRAHVAKKLKALPGPKKN